ncbi:prolipoprotein diacylglyceryl transferase [Psychrosphaera ytuae]|uniref:Phosphatidylglycerol--prolipoprotein diacylglyceryl transferase n=2 Tax=Psychrosphaera ytuae TaxID=2820710 RepID=A0A975DDT8_9GAMM|nr:prolipoprotein diacylglyceryl transferase [Psychrosphaera ytuae]
MVDPIIFPQIDPVMFSIGPLSVHWYGMMYLVGLGCAYFLAMREVKAGRSPFTEQQVSDLLFYGFMGAVLGGRLGYVFFYQFERFVEDPMYLFMITQGGMSFHGGLLGVLTVLLIISRKTKLSFLQIGDFVAPLVPIGLGAGRLGNFINGELWGRTTDVPWGIVFPTGGPLPRHPSQLYEFFLEGLVLFGILYWFSRKPRQVGAASGIFLLGYGSFRFIVEYFRQPDDHLGLLTLGMSMGQWLSLPMAIAGGVLMVWALKTQPKGINGKLEQAAA